MTETPIQSALVRVRHDGWTPSKQRMFVEVLADTGCVSRAAEAAGMSTQSAYNLRRRHATSMFARGWDAAIKLAQTRLIDAAFERALGAEEVAVFYKGEQIGTRRKYDNRLLTFLIQQGDKLDRLGFTDTELIALWPVILEQIDTVTTTPETHEFLARAAREGEIMMNEAATSSTLAASDHAADWFKPGGEC